MCNATLYCTMWICLFPWESHSFASNYGALEFSSMYSVIQQVWRLLSISAYLLPTSSFLHMVSWSQWWTFVHHLTWPPIRSSNSEFFFFPCRQFVPTIRPSRVVNKTPSCRRLHTIHLTSLCYNIHQRRFLFCLLCRESHCLETMLLCMWDCQQDKCDPITSVRPMR